MFVRAAQRAAGRDPGAVLWAAVVTVVYLGATIVEAAGRVGPPDRMMTLAANMFAGRFDLGPLTRLNDIVVIGGRNYEAISPGPVIPYLLFVPFHPLWAPAHWIIPAVLGAVAAWLALPLARRYGPEGPATYWLAALGAFGTLLLTQASLGNFYYLAQVEAVLFTFVALIEWQGKRRPWLLALAFGLAGLARPTLLLAAVPFGLVLLYESRDRLRVALTYGVPLAGSVLLMGLFDFARFGSPLETGYGLSRISADLAVRRSQGLFSLSHLPDNVRLLVAGAFSLRSRFPYLVPDPNGTSLLLTSPALLMALLAGLRDRTVQVLWAATAIVAVPVLLYCGYGGPVTYGYRYALDFIPFLFALSAIGARRHFAAIEKVAILASILFVSYGLLWSRRG
jgi:hypothetical protein